MMQKKRRWPLVIVGIVVFMIACDLFLVLQTTQGAIELPAELPSPEMMAHITANLEQLVSPNGPFTRSDRLVTSTVLAYEEENGLSIMLQLTSGASADDVLAAASTWQGEYTGFPDILVSMFDCSKYLLYFTGSQGPMTLLVTQPNADAISTAPLEEAIALIQSIIGTP